MKKILLGIGATAVVLVGALVGAIVMQPTEVHIERSKTVAASPEDVWVYTSDLRRFVEWSPWEDIDPNQKTEFSDPSGVGAWYTWHGNDQVGRGRMAITSVEENRKVVEDLEFIEPFAAKAVVTFVLEPVDGGTKVTWGYDGHNDFMGKAFSLVVDMDEMLGADFSKGLDGLGALSEAAATARLEAEAARKAAEEAAAAAAAAAVVPVQN